MAKTRTRRSKQTRNVWTRDELKQLKREYPKARTQDIADQMGRSYASVQQKAFNLDLTKSKRKRAR